MHGVVITTLLLVIISRVIVYWEDLLYKGSERRHTMASDKDCYMNIYMNHGEHIHRAAIPYLFALPL